MLKEHPPTDIHPDHQHLVDEYEGQGYHHVHIRHDNAGMVYAPHYHPFHVVLHVLDGELDVKIDDQHKILTKNEKISIDVGRFHTTCVGKTGCVYLHAEKHVTS